MRCSWDQTNIRQRKDIKENGFFVVVMFACVAWPGHDAKLNTYSGMRIMRGSDESMEDIQSEKSQKVCEVEHLERPLTEMIESELKKGWAKVVAR